jgi:hypothetical protein
MKLSSTSVLFSVLCGSFVSAAYLPLDTRQNDMKMMNPSPKGNTVGAAYFITNEPNANFVVSADIGSDGKLTLRQAVNARGKGAHGQTDPAGGPDPLFSQGAVKASAAAKMLATVNAGSNTVSLFSIDPKDPAKLNLVGRPQNTGGEFPMSLAFNKEGKQLCVLNGGKVNGVNCFKVDQKKGLVSQANTKRDLGINQTTPATGPAGSTSHVIFSEDGKQLVASVKGTPPTPGFLAMWNVEQDGSLSADFQKVAPEKGGLLPFSMTAIPGKNAILATDAGLGFDIFDMSNKGDVKGNNAKSSANEIKGQKATCWSSFSQKTKNFYLTDIGTSIVTEVNVDNNLKGTIVKQYPQGDGSGTIDNDIAAVGNNDFMYVLAANATAVDVLSLNAPGKAQSVQKLDVAGPAKGAGLPVNKDNLQGMTTFMKK